MNNKNFFLKIHGSPKVQVVIDNIENNLIFPRESGLYEELVVG